ncbi:nitroreductase family protein [Saccharicrinis aurantiacus]|uniref:nitroreductase family protein n=1 Tax=Saccharicrinis aurantiacus TaxID=1849719 RepID=UPI002492CC82|nr:nitroreductase family protein [Saccharicrinis aurantiacus]
MTTINTPFEEIVRSRRSMRRYDQTVSYDKSIVKKSLELAMLSPNSSNMQLWEFYRVTSDEAKKNIAHFCLDQNTAKTASELVVFVARPDHVKRSIQHNLDLVNDENSFEKKSHRERRRTYYSKTMPMFYSNDFMFIFSLLKKLFVTLIGMKKPMVREVTAINKKVTIHKSVALAAQTFMLAVKSYGYDTCPLEGFDSKRIKKYLGLPKAAEINMVITVGKGTEEGIWYPQKRYDYDVVVKEV